MGARFGQHFLASDGHRKRIVEALRLTGVENVLEIGPGQGAITGMAAERAARLIAIELDPILAAGLRERFADNPRIEIVEGDILEVPLERFDAPAIVLGNLPYYITSPILMRLFGHARLFTRIVVMVQREVAERIVAEPGTHEYSLLSLTTRFYTEPRLLFTIPPGAFHPVPRVHSAVISMNVVPPRMDNPAPFFRLARAAFAHKRKTLVNNLKPLYGVDRAKQALDATGLDPSVRAEELSLEKFTRLFSVLG